jgi:hypothetical protein
MGVEASGGERRYEILESLLAYGQFSHGQRILTYRCKPMGLLNVSLYMRVGPLAGFHNLP